MAKKKVSKRPRKGSSEAEAMPLKDGSCATAKLNQDDGRPTDIGLLDSLKDEDSND